MNSERVFDMNLEYLTQLVVFAEEGSLSKAADVLLISQPSLSRNMQRLEETLNVPLFERRKNKLILTDTGHLAVQEAKQLLHNVHTFKQKIQNFYLRQSVLFGGTCAPAPKWELENTLGKEAFARQIKLDLKDSDDLESGLLNGDYDFVFTEIPLQDDNIISEAFFKEVLYLTVPAKHALANKSSITLEDMAGLTMLLRTELGIWQRFIKQLPHTTFIQQDDDATFHLLTNASDIPIFTTNVTQKYAQFNDERRHIPIDAPHASITFYINVLKNNRALLTRFVHAKELSSSTK